MELRDLNYFCLTAELEHVSKAAERLGVSQPFLTKIIGQLEEEIGINLFDNLGRKIKLNQNGEAFYTYAKKVLGEMDNLYAGIDNLLDKQERTITILADTEGYNTDIVLEYKKAYPKNNLSIIVALRKDIAEALATGAADFAITTPPLAIVPSKGIVTEPLYVEYGCVLLPPNHRLLGRKSVNFDDLKDEQMITSPIGAGVRTNLEEKFQEYNFHPQIVCESNNMGLIIRSVMSGMGYSIMPRSLMNKKPELKQYCVDLDIRDASGQIALSYNQSSDSIKRLADFMVFIKEFFKKLDVDTSEQQ